MSRTPPSPPADRLDDAALRAHPLPDDGEADKHGRGTVLVVGGSGRTPGAVILAGRAALRIGAGRLQLVTSADVAAAVAVAVPESMTAPFAAADRAGRRFRRRRRRPGPHRRRHRPHRRRGSPRQPHAERHRRARRPRHRRRCRRPGPPAPTRRPRGADAEPSGTGPARRRHRGRPGDVGLPRASGRGCHGAALISFGCVATADGSLWFDPTPVAGLGTSGAGDVLAGLAGGAGARTTTPPRVPCGPRSSIAAPAAGSPAVWGAPATSPARSPTRCQPPSRR